MTQIKPNQPAAGQRRSSLLVGLERPFTGVPERGGSATSDTMSIWRIFIFTAIVALAGCSRAPVITVTNHSAVGLSNVLVSGSGFSEHIDSVASGSEHSFTVHPKGETGVRVGFDASGKHVDSGDQGYFEAGGGYRVSVTVSTNLDVAVASDLRSY